ncbi:unnamed protein product [Lymnaea stagnalis]|uniref:Calmodulin n=1 Tax=Lymnaea stagnalis TaxID=6523 RepID=A0AAV2IJR6_LYMST
MGNWASSSRNTEAHRRVQTSKKKYQEMLKKREAQVLQMSHVDDAIKESRDIQLKKNLLQRLSSCVDQTDSAAVIVKPEEYRFPFENLIFEGGGNKGLAYVGCIKYLEEIGMMSQIRRIGGSSAGAITAALVALGYSARDIEVFLSDNIEDVFLDHSCGYLSLLPNLIRKFGWNPGKKIFNWFGDRIKSRSESNNPDMTFYDLYRERQMELCVVVTNLNQMRSEYCHPKTTPDMPIREALRMSMAIPGVFTARVYDNHGQFDTYVDGGVLCNYPIQCYDGWFLSMDKADTFLRRMNSLKDLPNIMAKKFEPFSDKSIGFLLFDDTEMEVMRFNLEKRLGSTEPKEPTVQTKLFKQKQKKKALLAQAEREHGRMVRAVEAFMRVLDKHNLTDLEYIDRDELKNALQDKDFSEDNAILLFGDDIDVNSAFNILDKDGNGKIAFIELVQFIEEHGIRMQTRFQGYGRREVTTFFEFLSALQNTLLTNLKYVFVGEKDVCRTVGINTGHVGTSDYTLEDADRDFVIARGYNATRSFLQYYVVQHGENCGNQSPELFSKKNIAIREDDSEASSIGSGALNEKTALLKKKS